MNFINEINQLPSIKNLINDYEIKPLKKETITFLNWFSEYNLVPKECV